jgi:hypothetical protein
MSGAEAAEAAAVEIIIYIYFTLVVSKEQNFLHPNPRMNRFPPHSSPGSECR